MKKEWTKPKLVVLFRARADENVLGFCKLKDGADTTNPSSTFYTCDRGADPTSGECQPDCEAEVTS